MSERLMLTADELQELTGYRQHRRQLRRLVDRLKIKPVVRPDGLRVRHLDAAIARLPGLFMGTDADILSTCSCGFADVRSRRFQRFSFASFAP